MNTAAHHQIGIEVGGLPVLVHTQDQKFCDQLAKYYAGFVSPSGVARFHFEVEQLAQHLPAPIADVVLFLFFSTWQVGEARTLQWRDYDRTEGVIRLRPEHSKNKHGRLLSVEGELAVIIERRWAARRLDCP